MTKEERDKEIKKIEQEEETLADRIRGWKPDALSIITYCATAGHEPHPDIGTKGSGAASMIWLRCCQRCGTAYFENRNTVDNPAPLVASFG